MNTVRIDTTLDCNASLAMTSLRGAKRRSNVFISAIANPECIMYIAAMLCLSLLCGCSIFDLKNPEPPLVGVKTEDPLNIGDILSVVSEPPADMEYSDYFVSGVVFEYTLFRTITGRGELINMLNRLRTQASLVEWQPEKAEKRFEGNWQIVENMPYTVYSGGKTICTGLADFRIVRESEWVISYWKDVPDGGYIPFFEP